MLITVFVHECELMGTIGASLLTPNTSNIVISAPKKKPGEITVVCNKNGNNECQFHPEFVFEE